MTIEHGETWGNIPSEMRALPQWCLAGPDKAPVLVNAEGDLYNASPVTGPWMSFELACYHALDQGLDIGFIITEQDPFVCIDFDVKDAQSVDKHGQPLPRSKWTTPFALERYLAIKNAFNSYTELSRSHKGMHIWLRGNVPAGIKRDGVEVYSKERFIVCTGIAVRELYYSNFVDIVLAVYPRLEVLPIIQNDELLERLVMEIGGVGTGEDEDDPLEELEPTEPDEAIWQRAVNADNGAKFKQLCEGNWQAMGYPSQSEADLSLLSMFTFYSKSFSQVRRMFRQTGLGIRAKAVKDDVYLNRSLKLIRNRIRKADERAKQIQETSQLEVQRLVQQMQQQHVQQLTTEAIASVPVPQVDKYDDGLQWPPGMAGALAAFIYNSAPRPVKEVAIVAALGLLAGIVGKCYNIPQSGLNLYIVLIARSAIGKEAMHSGIALILEKVRNSVPGVERFVDFTDYASGPALTKACAEAKSFVNISGEFGHLIKELANEGGRAGPKQSLRKALTNLYQKSGAASIVGGIKYSNKESNVGSVAGVAYSMIGETTPKNFYDSLTESMMEDGWMSRFNLVEYDGERPELNENPVTVLDDRLYTALCSLIVQSITLIQSSRVMMVDFAQDAYNMLSGYNRFCDAEINKAGDDESKRQMWNRAHLKALRVSAILAVADNFVNPVVTAVHSQWAIDLINRDIQIMSRKISEGDVGQGDGVRERKLVSVIKSFFTAGTVPASYKIPQEMIEVGIVPRKFLQMRTATLSQFATHRLGATTALDLTLKSLIDSGYIMEVDKVKMLEAYNFHGRCFRVLNLH